MTSRRLIYNDREMPGGTIHILKEFREERDSKGVAGESCEFVLEIRMCRRADVTPTEIIGMVTAGLEKGKFHGLRPKENGE